MPGNTYDEAAATRTLTLIPRDGGWDTRGLGVSGAEVVDAATTLYTPASGKKFRLLWIGLTTKPGQEYTRATIKIGTTAKYIFDLSSPGAFSRSGLRQGDMDEALSIELSPEGQEVAVNWEGEDF